MSQGRTNPGSASASAGRAVAASMLDRSRPPRVGEAKAFHFPEVARSSIRGGLQVLAIRRTDTPLVALRFVNRAGAHFDPPAQAGLASFVGSLLDEGTRRRNAVTIADQVEGLGGYLASGADWDSCEVSTGVLSEHLPFCLDLVAEVATEPAFDPAETARIKALRLAELQRLLADPATLAGRAFARALYRAHLYAGSLVGTPESIAELDRLDCESFWSRHSTQRGAFLLAAGDLDPAALHARVEAAFAGLGSTEALPLPALEHTGPASTEVHVVDLPNAAQAELRIGHLGVPRQHPERPTLLLLNSILGGKFTSRINLNLRERHGFTYGASSRFIDRLGPGPFLISAAVDTAVTGRAVEETVAELRRLHDEPPELAELEDSRSYLLGVFPYTLQTLDGLVARLEEVAVYGLPLDYFATFPERLRAVTVADVNEAARRHLAPERLVIAAAGPAATLVPQLEPFGPVVVHPPRL
jgi:zinc protease